MLTYSGCSIGTAETENGSPAESLFSGEGELPEEAGDSPGTSRDTEEEATLSDEFYSHDTDEEEDQSKRRRDRSSSVSEGYFSKLNHSNSGVVRFLHAGSTTRCVLFLCNEIHDNSRLARRHLTLRQWPLGLAVVASRRQLGGEKTIHKQSRAMEAAERERRLRRASQISADASAGQETVEE